MKFLLIPLLFLCSTISEAQVKTIEFVDMLHGFLTEETEFTSDLLDEVDLESSGLLERSGYFLANANVVLGNLNYLDLDLFNEQTNGYDEFSADHPIITELLRKYPDTPIEIDTSGRLVIQNDILIANVSFDVLELENLRIKGYFVISDPEFPNKINDNAWIANCHIDRLMIGSPNKGNDTTIRYFYLQDNQLDTASLNGTYGEWIEVVNNTFQNLKLWTNHSDNLNISENFFNSDGKFIRNLDSNFYNRFTKNQHIIQARDIHSSAFTFSNNIVNGDSDGLVSLHFNSDRTVIAGNKIASSLFLNESTCSERFYFYGNSIDGLICFNEFSFPETYNYIVWDDMKGKLSSYYYDMDVFEEDFQYDFNTLGSSVEMEDTAAVDNLFRDYYQLYLIFKQNGNLRYANSSYSDMKDLETKRALFVYQHSGQLKDWFRWRLGQLLKFYTDNGTDPARALTISFYIILIFGILYFFYPSDWDVTSKSKLLSNLRSAFNRHESGTFKSVIRAIMLLGLSLVNALTLSLNSFVTLGFGNIPTHGLARYVCILQGFIGWFLLSLFTVALINQVLF